MGSIQSDPPPMLIFDRRSHLVALQLVMSIDFGSSVRIRCLNKPSNCVQGYNGWYKNDFFKA